MEEALENGKESPHSVHANGLIDLMLVTFVLHIIAFNAFCILTVGNQQPRCFHCIH